MRTIDIRLTRQSNAKHFGVDINCVITIPLEEYVFCVVASEIGNSPIEACKAQAIAARTFTYPYLASNKPISDDSSKHQAYRAGRFDKQAYPNVQKAINETKGQLLAYNGEIIKTCAYSSSNGGYTTSAKDRWGSHREWLIEQEDPWDLAVTKGKKSGHGVGMSQMGAIYAAKQGVSYEEILAFYYPGTTVVSLKEDQSMAKVKASYLIDGFKKMQSEEWDYVWGSAKDGEVDCSGAFTYLYKKAGSYMYHGSNTMYRKYTIEKGRIEDVALVPGMAVFKMKNDGKEPEAYRNDGLGNFYHVGLYIGNGEVIEAQGTANDMEQSSINTWTHAAKLVDTEYDVSEGDNNETPVQEEICCEGKVSTSGGILNLRVGPSTKTARLAKIPNGATVRVLNKSVGEDGWLKIQYGNAIGYVDGNYIEMVDSKEYTLKISVKNKLGAQKFQEVLRNLGVEIVVTMEE